MSHLNHPTANPLTKNREASNPFISHTHCIRRCLRTSKHMRRTHEINVNWLKKLYDVQKLHLSCARAHMQIDAFADMRTHTRLAHDMHGHSHAKTWWWETGFAHIINTASRRSGVFIHNYAIQYSIVLCIIYVVTKIYTLRAFSRKNILELYYEIITIIIVILRPPLHHGFVCECVYAAATVVPVVII